MILTAPSYIIPGTYLENIAYLARSVDSGELSGIWGVELLFFFFDPETDELYAKEREGVESYRDRFIFTVHMPDDLTAQYQGIVEMTKDIALQYILHPPVLEGAGGTRGKEFGNLVQGWIGRYGDRFLIENLIGRDLEQYLNIENLRICLDVGHLLLNNGSPTHFLEHYGDRVRQIHLHGLENGADHKKLDSKAPWFRDLVPLLRDFKGVVELEVFDADTLRYNIEVLKSAGVL